MNSFDNTVVFLAKFQRIIFHSQATEYICAFDMYTLEFCWRYIYFQRRFQILEARWNRTRIKRRVEKDEVNAMKCNKHH